MIIIIFGVSGCGKSTIARGLSNSIGIPYYDADDFHPQANIDKMSSGYPLNDSDRSPWLETLSKKLNEWENKGGAILACSALKEKYRKVLSSKIDHCLWIFLYGSYELILQRMNKRKGHYMSGKMLESQFDVLEVPSYGIHVNIENSPEEIVALIKSNFMSNKKSEFGVFGLGVMGSSISMNIADKGFELSVYNRAEGEEKEVVSRFLSANPHVKNLRGFTDLKEFIASLQKPRKILIMIKAGPTVDLVLNNLLPLLSEGDIIIDGGNSHYVNTKKRYELAQDYGVDFIGAGVSGGEEGARKGPSIMPGGSRDSYKLVAEVLESIAARDDFGKTCCTYIGPEGSGHFIKMVHNGIEYVEMQLLAELYALMSNSMSNLEIAEQFESWNKGDLSSYLLGITVQILRKREGDEFLLDLILDKAGNKGTGSWSSKAAFDLGIPNTMMSSAVFARYISSFKSMRVKLSGLIDSDSLINKDLDLQSLEKGYKFARLVNHQQGFKLMELASETYDWDLNFSEISRIWSNGCIIKSELINKLHNEFKSSTDLFEMDFVKNFLVEGEKSLKESIMLAVQLRISTHCFTSAYYYWIDMTTKRLPANLIQAQRDFFGAHTFQRIDAPDAEVFHSKW